MGLLEDSQISQEAVGHWWPFKLIAEPLDVLSSYKTETKSFIIGGDRKVTNWTLTCVTVL